MSNWIPDMPTELDTEDLLDIVESVYDEVWDKQLVSSAFMFIVRERMRAALQVVIGEDPQAQGNNHG